MSVVRRLTLSLMQQHGGSRSRAATRRASVREYILQMTSTDDVTSIKTIPSIEQSFHERVNNLFTSASASSQAVVGRSDAEAKTNCNDRLQTLIINNLYTLGS